MKTRALRIALWIGGFLSLLPSWLGGQITWSSPVVVAEGSSPDLAIDRARGRIHVVTKKMGITYTVLDSTGRVILQEAVSGSLVDQQSWDGGPAITVDKAGNPHVCYRHRLTTSPDWYYNIYYTTRQNNRWTTPLLVASGKRRGFHVRMAADAEGSIHIVVGEKDGTEIWGFVSYYQIKEGVVRFTQTNIGKDWYRADNTPSIGVDLAGNIHLLLGCPGHKANPSEGSINYFRRSARGGDFFFVTRFDTRTGQGRTCFPDVFLDRVGGVHVSYGSNSDAEAGGGPAVRYVRYQDNSIRMNRLITRQGDLDPYSGGAIWGVSSLATTDDGQGIIIAYLSSPKGEEAAVEARLRVTMSCDSGKTWSPSLMLCGDSGGEEARNRPVIRAYKDHFFLVYPDNADGKVKLRRLWNGGDGRPVAVLDPLILGQEGTPVRFDASRSYDVGQNPRIIRYRWDLDGDGRFDVETSDPAYTRLYRDDYTGALTLIVQDKWGQADTARAQIQIANVPPKIRLGPDRVLQEGDTLILHAEVLEPGDDATMVYFRLEGESWIGIKPFVRVFEDDGQFTLYGRVVDDDGGVGLDTLRIQVRNVPPTATIQGPRVGSKDMELRYEAIAWDPGIRDVLSYAWDMDGDGIYERKTRVVTVPYAEEGVYRIRLRVTDKDGEVGMDSLLVRILNAPPTIAYIPDQAYTEGTTIRPLELDRYVSDPVVGPERIRWEVSGNAALLVSLQNRILSVAVPDSEWSGEERLRLVATNHIGLKDTGFVTYRILPVNDPPRWIQPIPDFSIEEDDTLTLAYEDLLRLVFDPDHPKEVLRFRVPDNPVIDIQTQERALLFIPKPDWAGQTPLIFHVFDPEGGVGTDTSRITVIGLPDTPAPFRLIEPMYVKTRGYPDSLLFLWHKTEVPDSDVMITYEWILAHQGGGPGSPVFRTVVFDTSYTFPAPRGILSGTYFWWVKAHGEGNASRRSENMGFVVVEETTAVRAGIIRSPEGFALYPNYPNPFNPETRIFYHLDRECEVDLAVFNPLGQRVKRLDMGKRLPGPYTVVWDGCDEAGRPLQSGLYLCRLQAGDRVLERKMLLLR